MNLIYLLYSSTLYYTKTTKESFIFRFDIPLSSTFNLLYYKYKKYEQSGRLL